MSFERARSRYSYVVMDALGPNMEELDEDEAEVKPTPRAFFSSTYGVDSISGLFENTTYFQNVSWSTDMNQKNANGTFVYNFYFYETVQFAVMWLLFIAIVAGNSSVIAALLLSKSRKSRMNYFIMQLAIADLFVGLISVLTDIIQKMTITWMAGNVACKIIRFLQVLVTYSSTYVLVALSIDRCDAITHPMNFTGSKKRAKGLIASAWILSMLFSIPILVLYEERVIQDQLQCWIDLGTPRRWQVYMTCVSVTLFVLPALTITACYTVIVITIWAKSKIVMSPTTTSKRLKNARLGNTEDLSTRRASSRGLIPRAKIKTVKMTFVIVFVFILCWSPYMVFDLLQVYDCIPRTQTSVAVATLVQSLAPLNSAANPLIYCIFSTHVFRSLKKIPPFKWLCCVRGGTAPRGGVTGGPTARGVGAGGTLRSHTDSTTVSEMLSSSRRRRSTLQRNNSSEGNREATGMTLLNNSVKRLSSRNSEQRHSLMHEDSCRSLASSGPEDQPPVKHVQLVLPPPTNSK